MSSKIYIYSKNFFARSTRLTGLLTFARLFNSAVCCLWRSGAPPRPPPSWWCPQSLSLLHALNVLVFKDVINSKLQLIASCMAVCAVFQYFYEDIAVHFLLFQRSIIHEKKCQRKKRKAFRVLAAWLCSTMFLLISRNLTLVHRPDDVGGQQVRGSTSRCHVGQFKWTSMVMMAPSSFLHCRCSTNSALLQVREGLGGWRAPWSCFSFSEIQC